MRLYPPASVERAMKVQEVILRAISGEITWIRASEIVGISTRSMRRWKERYEEQGYDGLLDRRTGRPSPRRASVHEVQRILGLYREHYQGFNVLHFHQIARRDHQVGYSYTFVKKALQEAGLVKKGRKRRVHRRFREPKPCFGQMLHVDGSKHAWLVRVPEKKQVLIAVLDDATKYLLYAQLWPGETTVAVMTALKEVTETYGIPQSLYSDRASWAFHTKEAGGKVDRENLTQVGRALERLGVEHIAAYSPQARGRMERMNRTLQDRLVNELRLKGIRTLASANRYLREVFLVDYNQRFTRPAQDPHNMFVSASNVDLDQIFCIEQNRRVAPDNTVVMDRVRLQLEAHPSRKDWAGLKVTVRRHLDGSHTVWHGIRLLGRFETDGNSKTKAETSLRSSKIAASSPSPRRPSYPSVEIPSTGHFMCYEHRTT